MSSLCPSVSTPSQALGKTLVAALTDAVMKDIVKQSRNALSDKCLVVQRAAAEVHKPYLSLSFADQSADDHFNQILLILYPIGDGARNVSDA